MQRSFFSLLKGDLLQSLHYYPALIPLMVMMVYLYLNLWLRFKNGKKILTLMLYLNVIIVLIHYVLKLLQS